jgi:apolipoprotein N-acyltransferase
MDYVQRFAASGGNVRLAPDTRSQRLAATARYLPLLLVALLAWFRCRHERPRGLLARWGFPLSLGSALLMALAFPSFANPGGWGLLAFPAYLPLFAVLAVVSPGRAIFYGTAVWTIQTMLTNYWLGTYSLISLQLVTVLLGIEGVAFFAIAVAAHRLVIRHLHAAALAVFPLAWTVFDWLRSAGFSGYPWGIIGATQYTLLPLIQTAAVTGVWGVGFLLLLPASGLAHALVRPARRGLWVFLAGLAPLSVALAAGALRVARPAPTAERTVRLALIQQNNDPRKDEYASTLATLGRLTDATLAERPDLVVWSETAFVPNIRRWGALDPAEHPLADLVHRFLEYQRGLGTWLITGNDDYELRVTEGVEERLDYNATILFSPAGERVQTYHKIRLVPFTESFPWKEEMPGAYELLKSFDVYLWEPGTDRVIFQHPKFRFATPICFEDAFPDHVRRFVLEGLDVILNVSNDYWSLTEVEARQHAANAVFRAVENRRPVVRATASGLTVHIDPLGRRLAELVPYTEDTLVVDVPLPVETRSPYTAAGDWFPAACAAVIVALAAAAALRRRRSHPTP